MKDPLNIVKEADTYREKQGDIKKGISLLEKHLKELEKDSGVLSFYIPLFSKKLGDFYRDIGNTQKALEMYKRGLEVARNDLNKMEEADILVALAFLELKIGTTEKALNYAHKAWEYIGPKRGAKFAEVKSNTLAAMGNIHFEDGDNDEALDCYRKAIKVARKHNIAKRVITVTGDIANVYLNKGSEGVALGLLKKLLPEAKGSYRVAVPQIYIRIGKIYLESKECKKAEENFKKALDYAQEESLVRDIGESYEALGDVFIHQNISIAHTYYEKALKQYERGSLTRHTDSLKQKIKRN